MKTTFGRKRLLAIENREFIAKRVINGVALISGKAFSRDRLRFPGRYQSRCATHHRGNVDCRDFSREAQTLQGSRNLPDDCASLESADERAGNVAIVLATSEARNVQGSS
jgi:hypothetical protein